MEHIRIWLYVNICLKCISPLKKQSLVVYIVRVLCCFNVNVHQEQRLQNKTLELQISLEHALKKKNSEEEKH